MKLTCRQQDLARGLSAVSHAVSARSSLPILANILLATDSGRLKLAATNLEIGVTCWVDAQISEGGATTVPAKLLTDFVSTLAAEPSLTLGVSEGTNVLHLRGLRSSAHFRGMDAVEFPLIPGAEGSEASLLLAAALLKEVIEQVAFSAADDETRPALTGVLLQIRQERITFAAADAFRLAMREVALDGGDQPCGDLLVPARTLKELGRILPPEGTVELIATPSRNQVLFHTPQLDLVSRLLDATFPNFRQIIPKSHATRAVVPTREFAGDVRRAALFAQDSSNIMRLKIEVGEDGELGAGTVGVQAQAEDLGDNDNRLQAAVDGPGIELILNARYLADVLSAIGTPEVAIEATTPAKPVLLLPVGSGASRYVIMPLNFQR
jgi:DNA polymerase-3 subunit beta